MLFVRRSFPLFPRDDENQFGLGEGRGGSGVSTLLSLPNLVCDSRV